MSPKPDVSETRKSQILEAAMKVFSRQGFHEARMDDIVAESGLSKGALYWYYKSKDDVIMAILDQLFERELASLISLKEQEIPARQAIEEFITLTIGEIKQFSRLLPILYEFYALAFRHKTIRETLRIYLSRYIDLLQPILQKGIDQGDFRPVDAGAIAFAFGAILEGTLLLWAFDPQGVDLERQLGQSFEVFLKGLEAC